jgi:hypothetical protein
MSALAPKATLFDARQEGRVLYHEPSNSEAARHAVGIHPLICPTRLGKNGRRFRELMYDSVYDESYVQDR